MNLPPEAKEILARTARVLHKAGVDESIQHLVEADLLLMYVCGSTETIRGMIERLNAEKTDKQ